MGIYDDEGVLGIFSEVRIKVKIPDRKNKLWG